MFEEVGPNDEKIAVPTLVYTSFETKGGNHKDATCFEPGESEIICGGCGEVLKEELDQLTHNYVHVKGDQLDGNKCIDGTFDADICILCNDVQNAVYNEDSVIGHHTANNTWTEVATPTEDAAGEIKGICTVCETEQTMELPKLNSNDYDHYVTTCVSVAAGGALKESYNINLHGYEATYKFDYEITHKVVVGGQNVSFVEDGNYEYTYLGLTAGHFSGDTIPDSSTAKTAFVECDGCHIEYSVKATGTHTFADEADKN